jgi:DNA repair protein RadC
MYEFKIVRERRSGYGSRKRFRSSADVYESFQEHFATLDREHFVVLLLDAKNVMLGFHTVSIGSLTASLVHPREVFKPVVLHNDQVTAHALSKEVCEQSIRCSAAAVILMHNHPSGDPVPSQEDQRVTTRLRELGEVVCVRVLDHLIFGDGHYVSFVDDGYWDKEGGRDGENLPRQTPRGRCGRVRYGD